MTEAGVLATQGKKAMEMKEKKADVTLQPVYMVLMIARKYGHCEDSEIIL